MDYNRLVPGTFYGHQQCDFIIWAPLATDVQLLLGADELPLKMHRHATGYWMASAAPNPGERYWFLVDGKKLADPASLSQPDGVHGASSICDRNYMWSDGAFRPTVQSEMIQYELHVGTFSTAGTFAGIVDKFDHLKSLGVNALEIMPIAQFPGERNWGYDGVFPFAVQNSYGGLAGFKNFVDKAHIAGFTVILDVVYNHAGPEGSVLKDSGPYFTEAYNTGWGDAINFDGAYSDGVRDFFLENVRFWLEDCHVDALRLDAVHAIYDNGAKHIIQAMQQVADEVSIRSGKKKLLIAEIDLNNPRYLDAPEHGGYGIAAQWADEFHHALHTLVTGERDGYYEDFGAVEDLRKAMRDSWVYTGQYSRHRKRHFGAPTTKFHSDRFVIFSQNHDQIGNRFKGDRLASLSAIDQQKFCAAVILLSPQIPMLFMGEEYGETNPFCYFADHGDKELIQAVREGRKKEFAHFNWTGDIPDAFDKDIFSSCKLSWSTGTAERTSLLECYRLLIKFRKTRTALKGRERHNITFRDKDHHQLIILERSFDHDRVLIIFNPHAYDATWTPSPENFHVVLEINSSQKYSKEADPRNIIVGAWGVVLLEQSL